MSTQVTISPATYANAARRTIYNEFHIPDGADPAARIAEWLAGIEARPPGCEYHRATRMQFVAGSGSFHRMTEPYTQAEWGYHLRPCLNVLGLPRPNTDEEWVAFRRAASANPAAQRMIAGTKFEQPPPFPNHTFHAAFTCPACIIGRAGFPAEFHETSFEDWRSDTTMRSDALKLCREFATEVAQRQRGFLLMVGPTGTGKTRLAANIVRELPHLPALYCRQQEATDELRAAYGRREIIFNHRPFRGDGDADMPRAPAILTRLQSAKLLILDELFCVAQSKDEVALLDEIIKHRFDRALPTILMANLPFPEFKAISGSSLASRIGAHTGKWRFFLSLTGPDYRLSGAFDYLRAP